MRYNAPEGEQNIEELLSRCDSAQRFAPNTNVEHFERLMLSEIVKMCRFTGAANDFSVHEDFLRRVARRPARKPRMKLFTTNYDLSFERAASRSRFVVIDGFSHTVPQEFDGSFYGYDIVRREGSEGTPDYIENVFHLYKLHGSLDWERKAGRVVKNESVALPAIIYPRDSKFAASYEQPHLEMMARFLSVLRQPNTGLLVVGFGFADRHLAGPILAALDGNVSLKALIVGPEFKLKMEQKETNVEFRLLQRLAEARDPRLGVLNGTFAQLVRHIPDLVAPTEQERIWKLRDTAGASK